MLKTSKRSSPNFSTFMLPLKLPFDGYDRKKWCTHVPSLYVMGRFGDRVEVESLLPPFFLD